MSKKIEISESELNEISEKTGVDPDILKSWYKEFLKVSPSGRMNKKNFYKFYKMLRGNTENLHKITDYVFSCFDIDSNGYLDFSEFIIAYSSTSNNDCRKRLEFVFMFYDNDKDGIINDRDFLKVIEAMYEFKGRSKKEYPPVKCVQDIFRRIDENGDRRLSKDEFIEGCMSNKHILDLISPFEM
ncbi:neuronal calcium sensor 2 [Brachionus plicatilis]|uniref:Neuronal calcium sensor 2 n=1 Tax=Brachionus plicatilis TaxID=10195 RepID=A0A3M7QTN3_BRAPC|nr:neuronal calcium sensor 2 [Brachionus plicatilis]